MALADITLADGQGTPVSHVFTYINSVNGRVIRSDMTQSPETPLLLSLAHSSSTKKGVKISSHLMRIDRGILDGDGITVHAPNIRICADIQDAVYSDGLADDFAAFIRNWATSANVRAWLNNSVG